MERQLYRKTHLNTFKWVLRNYTDDIAHLKMDNPNMSAGCLKYLILNLESPSIYQFLTPKQIEKYKDNVLFDWRYASEFVRLSREFIEKYKGRILFSHLSKNKTLTPELIEEYADRINWCDISQNKVLTPELIDKYSNRLEWFSVSKFVFFTPTLIEKYKNRIFWTTFWSNPCMNSEIVEKYLDCIMRRYSRTKQTELAILPCYPHLTIEIIEKYRDKIGEYAWNEFAVNPIIIPVLDQYIDKISFSSLSRNKGLTPEIIRKYKDKLHWRHLSSNPCMTPELIEEYIDRIDFFHLSHNISISPSTIEKYKDRLNWERLSENPCMTKNLIKKYEEYIEWEYIASNKFLMDDEYCDRKIEEEKRKGTILFCIEKSDRIFNSGLLEWKLVNTLNEMMNM